MKNLKLFRWYDRSVGTVAALNWAAIINHIYPPRKSHLHAHYTPRSYLATQIFLSFICLLLDRNRKGSPAFEAALICSFRSSGRRRGVCVWRAESEQPSKRKLSQSFWHRHWRVVPFLILHEVRHFRQMPVFVNEGRWTDIHNVCPIHSVGCRSAAEGHSCQSAELKSVIMGAIVVSVIVLRVSTLTAQSDNQSGAPTI